MVDLYLVYRAFYPRQSISNSFKHAVRTLGLILCLSYRPLTCSEDLPTRRMKAGNTMVTYPSLRFYSITPIHPFLLMLTQTQTPLVSIELGMIMFPSDYPFKPPECVELSFTLPPPS